MVCVSLVLQLIGLLARVSAVPPLDAPVARAYAPDVRCVGGDLAGVVQALLFDSIPVGPLRQMPVLPFMGPVPSERLARLRRL